MTTKYITKCKTQWQLWVPSWQTYRGNFATWCGQFVALYSHQGEISKMWSAGYSGLCLCCSWFFPWCFLIFDGFFCSFSPSWQTLFNQPASTSTAWPSSCSGCKQCCGCITIILQSKVVPLSLGGQSLSVVHGVPKHQSYNAILVHNEETWVVLVKKGLYYGPGWKSIIPAKEILINSNPFSLLFFYLQVRWPSLLIACFVMAILLNKTVHAYLLATSFTC